MLSLIMVNSLNLLQVKLANFTTNFYFHFFIQLITILASKNFIQFMVI